VTQAPPEVIAEVLERAGVGFALFDRECRYRHVNERLAAINARSVEEHLGRTVDEVLLPELAAAVTPLVQGVIATREPSLATQAEGATPGGGRSAFEVSYLPVEHAGEPMVGVVVLDVTDREWATSAAQRRLRQQAALAEIARLALREHDLQRLFTTTTEMLVVELACERAGILEFAPGRRHLVMCAGTGFAPGAIGTMTAAVGPSSQAGYTLASGTAVVSNDTLAEQRFTFNQQLLDVGVRSAISVPIPGESQAFGVLGALASRVDNFDDDDANLLRAAANVLGAAVVRAAQSAEVERLAAQRGHLVAQALDAGDRERRQVADVLHDDVLQHLLFARLELGSLEGDGEARQRILESVEAAAATLRRVVGGLHPVTLAHAGLTTAIETLAGEHGARAGIEIDVAVAPAAEGREDRLVLALVRELLTNVVKHADASRAAVRVAAVDGSLSLQVADDGAGLPEDAFEAALARGNVGLANIRERVLALGGSVETGTGIDGRGALVAIRLPSV
jgi:PAS domain S-box-containing protein